jgi:hypothetical protein
LGVTKECVECNAKERIIFAERGRAQELAGWLNEERERRNLVEDRLHIYLGLIKQADEAVDAMSQGPIGGYESMSARARRLSKASLEALREEQNKTAE